jgi:GAF domain-containing protein
MKKPAFRCCLAVWQQAFIGLKPIGKINKQTPRSPPVGLLDELRNLPSLSERIDAIVEVVHSFVMPSRTSVYWFEREHRYFWRRAVNRQRKIISSRNDNTAGITVQNAPTMYQALSKDQLVVVVDAQSMTKGDISTCVLEQFGCIAIIAAPIVFQGELVGFLCVESDEPRLWTEDERSFTKGVSQLISDGSSPRGNGSSRRADRL